MKKIITTIFALVVLALALMADTYYVGPNEQYTTIASALSGRQNGDIIIVRDGTYSANFSLCSNYYTTGVSDITVKSEHGKNFCTLDCSDGRLYMKHGTVDGFNFIGTSDGSDFSRMVDIGDGYDQIYPPTIKNCSFDNVEGYWVTIYAHEDYNIENCRFTNISSDAIMHMGYTGEGPNSIVNITHCLFDNISGDAFHEQTYDYIYLNFYNNTVVNTNNGLYFEMGNNARHIRIKNCIFDNNSVGVLRGQGASDILITYSDFYNNEYNVYGCGPAENCIFVDPLLTEHILYLKTGSPCISSGESGSYMGWKNHEEEDKTFTKKWNWISFPRLLRWSNEPQSSIEIMQPLEPYAIQTRAENASMDYNSQSHSWNIDNLTSMQSCWGYKVEMTDDMQEYNYETYGEQLSEHYKIPEVLTKGEYHWLGYWLPITQNMDVAFGEFWDKVQDVKAQNWTYIDMNSNRGYGDPEPLPSMKIRPLEYGKMYMVKFKEDITDFHWTNSGVVKDPFVKEQPEHFTVEEKADYEVIDIVDIPEDVLEIGVYDGNKCVGATKVKETGEQIILYTDAANRDNEPITLELFQGRGQSAKVTNYSVMNFKTGEFENSLVYPNKQSYSLISLNNDNSDTPDIPTVNVKNYPNPFNPETTISYSILNGGITKLEIYNIQGQKIKTLVNGKQEAGNYKTLWKGKDNNGKKVSSGIYFYKLTTNGKTYSHKMIMLK